MDPTRRTIRLDDLIFKATDALLIGPDYAAIMQICDVLNNRKERVPLAVGVFKERLKHREKDVVLRTLELLDAVTKNVPESVQYVGSKDFLSVMKKMVTNKKTEFLVKETMLAYIQSCALAFKRKSGTHFHEVYDALRKEGVSFPPPEKEADYLFKGPSPAHSPKVPAQQQQQASSLAGWWSNQSDAVRSLDSAPAAGRKKREASHASAERAAGKEEKLLLAFSSAGVLGLEQELSLLQNSIDLAEDILRNARSRLDLQGDDILGQVFSSCQIAQPQVQSLLAVPSPPMTEDMVAALLYANDRLLSVQSLHQAIMTGKRGGTHLRAVSSDEEESSSSDDDDTNIRSRNTSSATEPIPQLLRGPPKARHPLPSTQHLPAGGRLGAPSQHQPPAEDILDEFAALALRHAPSSNVAASSPVTLPPQPYPMAFPYPAPAHAVQQPFSPQTSGSTLPTGGPALTNPFLLASPPAYFGTPPAYAATSLSYLPTTSYTPGSVSTSPAMPTLPFYPPVSQYPQFSAATPLPSALPAYAPAPQPAPAPSSIQDDFDLLFGKRQ